MTIAFDAVSAYDEAFSGKLTHVIDHIGRSQPFEVDQWSAAPDWVDCGLFIDPCDAATIDVGCGPGRIVAELAARKVPAMGIDVSAEAVRQTRIRGALALHRDVFAAIPGEGRWKYALLADGNLGIGGDPVRLLTRLRDLLTTDGQVIAEVAEHGAGFVREHRQLRVEGRLSASFEWAVVGLDAIEGIAALAGMRVVDTQTLGGRHTATMVRIHP
ncbi:SAM-dependent methyltransferase [Aeromicrobium sp. A1-2]|uniref:class I SAM-dependent methyltransferase n=1 Tax=Aeromicrobium sp. A1-2 TaxID=2107713 RepID=UPI000E4B1833|nr:class I SAM-dependent methyltransferase [Aeromicrobium sp. A1-2]AXT86614.1 SAM-dependent methyltransferase [Aeromicrobium sp. A1-2]